MSNDNVKVQITGAEISAWMDALQRIAESVAPYQKSMFVGGPLPADVALTLKAVLDDKVKQAAIGPVITPPARAPDQR
jgi:hypothetical protein